MIKLLAFLIFSSANAAYLDSVTVDNTVSVTGALTDTQLRASPVPVSGTFFQATQPISGTVTSNIGTIAGIATEATLSSMNTKLPSLGQTTMSASQPVAIASNQTAIPSTESNLGQKAAASAIAVTMSNENVQDMRITGQGTQTVIGNNILLATAGTGSIDVNGYRSGNVQIVSTGTAGTFLFEESNDGVNWNQMVLYNKAIITGTPITAAITANVSSLYYHFPIESNFIRVRIVTTITGGSLQAFSRFSLAPYTPALQQVTQTTAANLATTATIASGTVTTVSSVTSDNLAIPLLVTDQASAALTTTTTSATITPTNGSSYEYDYIVTAVSGTTPTLDVQIQESPDSGTNWFAVYDFPRITTTGAYKSPPMPLTGNRVRYVQTVAGTTPSFTRSVVRLQSSNQMPRYTRQMFDRTITLTSLSSTTPSIYAEPCSNLMLSVNIGTTTIAPILQLQGSDDGSTFYNIGSTLTSVASSTVSLTVNNVQSKFVRAIVQTAGTATVAGYVMVKGF